MGRSHALSAAVGWVAATTVCTELARHVDQLDWLPTPGLYTVAVGAVVAAGTGLLPDIDHPDATVSRTLGPITHVVARAVARVSAAIHAATATDTDRRSHRRGSIRY